MAVEVSVKNYTNWRRMEANAKKMLNDGWAVAGQSGRFSNTPIPNMILGGRVTVMWVRGERDT
jgi:hypothetical protein